MDKLTQKQIEWLRRMDGGFLGSISVTNKRPPTALMRRLESAGFCEDIMGVFWKITDKGRKMISEIDGGNHG